MSTTNMSKVEAADFSNPNFDSQKAELKSTNGSNDNGSGGKERVKGTVANFMENTSTHGFGSIIRSEHILRRLIWILIVMAGAGKS